jgi:hypothetical protein
MWREIAPTRGPRIGTTGHRRSLCGDQSDFAGRHADVAHQSGRPGRRGHLPGPGHGRPPRRDARPRRLLQRRDFEAGGGEVMATATQASPARCARACRGRQFKRRQAAAERRSPSSPSGPRRRRRATSGVCQEQWGRRPSCGAARLANSPARARALALRRRLRGAFVLRPEQFSAGRVYVDQRAFSCPPAQRVGCPVRVLLARGFFVP